MIFIIIHGTIEIKRGGFMINRDKYLENMLKWKDKDIIKVVTGVRRCGKSTLFRLYIEKIKQMGVTDE